MRPFDVEVFYDGDCPLCRREMLIVRRRDEAGRILFTDIAAPTFDPATIGRTRAQLMARLHGRLADGTILDGVEVFRRLYASLGFRRLVGFSRLPVVRPLLDHAYALFAKHRLRLTGRCEDGFCEAPGSKHVHPSK